MPSAKLETCRNINNSKGAYQLLTDLTSRDKSERRTDTETQQMDRIFLRATRHERYGYNAVLDLNNLQSLLREEVEIVVAALRRSRPKLIIPSAELVQAGVGIMIFFKRSVTRSWAQLFKAS